MGRCERCSTESICPEHNIPRMGETFASPSHRFSVAPARRRLVGPCRPRVDGMGETLRICGSKRGTRRNTEKERDWASTIVDVTQFGLPTVLAVGLAIDGLASGIVFYRYPWSSFPPFAGVLQVLGAVLLFLGLPLFTAGADLTGKYVD